MQVVGIEEAEPARNPDVVLDAAKGEYESVFVAGYDSEGCLIVRSSTNLDAKAILFMLEQFKHNLLSGGYTDES